MALLPAGLEHVPVVVGDIPDMSRASGKAMPASFVPPLASIEAANARLLAWAKEHTNVRVVPLSKMKEVAAIAKAVADKTKAGDPKAEGTTIGPVVNRTQWDKIQALIKKGVDEGATLVAGGPGLPEGVNKGFYVRPTIFADVTNDMTIAREEIFGPVLVAMTFRTPDEAVLLANCAAGTVVARRGTAARRRPDPGARRRPAARGRRTA